MSLTENRALLRRRSVQLILATAALCLVAPLAMAQQFELRVTGSRVNIRAKPTTSSDVLFQVSQGDQLRLIEEVGNWYFVETDNADRGYIFEQLVELVKLAPALESSPKSQAAKSGESEMDSELPVERIRSDGISTEPLRSAEAKEAKPRTEVEQVQAKSRADKQKQRGLYKMIGGAAGIVTGVAVMGDSKPAGIVLLGAGGYFAWNGYQDRQQAQKMQWGLSLQIDRDTKGLAYHMSW